MNLFSSYQLQGRSPKQGRIKLFQPLESCLRAQAIDKISNAKPSTYEMSSLQSNLLTRKPTFYHHNRDASRNTQIQTMLKQSYDYANFVDMTVMHWGKPSNNHARLAFSFYIASEIIIDTSSLKNSQKFQNMLSKHKLMLLPHTLLQIDQKAVAFFSGKSPNHTWREDLRRQFQLYVDEYLQNPQVAGQIFGNVKFWRNPWFTQRNPHELTPVGLA